MGRLSIYFVSVIVCQCIILCMYTYVGTQGPMANKVCKVCIYVLMYDCIYVLFVCRVSLYIHRHKQTLAQGIKSFMASQVWFQAVAGARTYGTDSDAITSQPH